MSKKANPTLVGSFVLVALGLAIAAIVILGNIRFKDNRFRCIAFFTGSLHGLDVGAAVTFRGVAVGRVNQITIHYDEQQKNYIIPVYIDIDQSQNLKSDANASWNQENVRETMERLIDQGLRAQLKVSSLLTSKLYIDLAFLPGTALDLHNKDEKLFEIPTRPSGLEQITQKLESLPLEEILHKTATALDGINSLINSEETRRALKSLDSTLNHLDTLLSTADKSFPDLTKELNAGLSNFATLSARASALLGTADKELPQVSRETQKLLISLDQTAGEAMKTLAHIKQITAKDSDLSYQVSGSLQEIEKAAASIRQLADYLQQYPNALIFGQGEEQR